jgi:hypothetical protein
MACVSFAIDDLLAVLDKPISDYEGYDIVRYITITRALDLV